MRAHNEPTIEADRKYYTGLWRALPVFSSGVGITPSEEAVLSVDEEGHHERAQLRHDPRALRGVIEPLGLKAERLAEATRDEPPRDGPEHVEEQKSSPGHQGDSARESPADPERGDEAGDDDCFPAVPPEVRFAPLEQPAKPHQIPDRPEEVKVKSGAGVFRD